MAAKQLGILYIDVNKMYFYGSNTKSVLQVEIPLDTLSYLDIINRDKFNQIIQAFITNNKIEPVPLILLLSPYATYEKDLVGKSGDEIGNEVQSFLSAVPYEDVMSRVYKLQDRQKVIAASKDLYEVVKHNFEKYNFSITGVVPFALLQKIFPDIGTSLNLEAISGKFEGLRQYSLVSPDEMGSMVKANQQATAPQINPLRLYGLIGVFVILFGILAFMVITSLKPQKKPTSVQVYTHPSALPSNNPTPILRANVGTSSGGIISPTVTLRK